MIARLSRRRRTFVLGVAAAGLALVAVGAVALVRAGDEIAGLDQRPTPGPGGTSEDAVPVVLVHGLGGTVENMTTIATRLLADGRETISVSLPEQGMGDIAASVREVERVVRASGADVVDLVGYSFGGVVVRAWVAGEPESAQPRRVVTIAAPQHGAQLAETVFAFDPSSCVEACAQLRPGSQFMRDLNAGDETPGPAGWYTVWTSLDTTVTPPESAKLDGAVNVRLQSVCADSDVGHGSINRDALPVGLVVLALRGELRTAPPPSQCAAVRALGR